MIPITNFINFSEHKFGAIKLTVDKLLGFAVLNQFVFCGMGVISDQICWQAFAPQCF